MKDLSSMTRDELETEKRRLIAENEELKKIMSKKWDDLKRDAKLAIIPVAILAVLFIVIV